MQCKSNFLRLVFSNESSTCYLSTTEGALALTLPEIPKKEGKSAWGKESLLIGGERALRRFR